MDAEAVDMAAAELGIDATGSELDAAITCQKTAFAHAVNSQADLAAAEGDDSVNFLESDVVLGTRTGLGESGASVSTGPLPVCAHDPGAPSDLSLQELVVRAAAAGKGVKVDIKQWSALGGALQILKHYVAVSGREEVDPLSKPTPLFAVVQGPATLLVPAYIVNADVLTGTIAPAGTKPAGRSKAAAHGCTFNARGAVLPPSHQVEEARTFLEAIIQTVPLAIVSPGWSTYGEGEGAYLEGSGDEGVAGTAPAHDPSTLPRYTDGMIDAMLAVVHDYAEAGVHFSFPVRASYVRASVGPLNRLLEAVPGSSLTVWSNVPLPASQEAWLRAHLDPSRTLYDLVPRTPSFVGVAAGGQGVIEGQAAPAQVVEPEEASPARRTYSGGASGPAAGSAGSHKAQAQVTAAGAGAGAGGVAQEVKEALFVGVAVTALIMGGLFLAKMVQARRQL